MQEADVLTIEEVAKTLRLSEKTVRKLIDSGELEAFRAGNQWRIRREVLEQYMKRKQK